MVLGSRLFNRLTDDVYLNQVTLMDANYVMDETLGTTTYDITKLTVGRTKMEPFLIGKVRHSIPADSGSYKLMLCRGTLLTFTGASFKY